MLILQDWVLVQVPNLDRTTTQSHSSYLDLGAVDDVVLYLDVESAHGTISLHVQTAPSADDASFQTIASFALWLIAPTSTPQVTMLLSGYTPTPLARFLRWQTAGGTSQGGSATFRITATTYAAGV